MVIQPVRWWVVRQTLFRILAIGIVVVFFCNCAVAQIFIKGTVSDSLGQPISLASVTLTKQRTGLVLAFAITNTQGYYELKDVSAKLSDTLSIQANMIGFRRYVIPVTKTIDVINLSLQPANLHLPDVIVRNNKVPITLSGDTLNYHVAALSLPQDRMIGDIIKRLPGIEVDENGKIKYQGKEINNFYIDGDNLLDGKYNIASNGIPVDIVDKIQVFDNHQPIKSLRNIQISNQPALNILLKNNARIKISGNGDIAGGLPNLYQGTANFLLLKKKIKFINYYKLNNTGVDLANELVSHFSSETNFVPLSLLNASADNPSLAKKRYFLNQTGLINFNDLFKLEPEVDIRINMSYLVNSQFQKAGSKFDFYLPTDTIRFAEERLNDTRGNSFNATVSLTANKSTYYLRNTILIENSLRKTLGGLSSTGNHPIYQMLNGSTTNISNELQFNKVIRKQKNISFYSFIGHISNPTLLEITPGLYEDVFNNNNSYGGLIQRAAVPTFYTNNQVMFRVSRTIGQKYTAGINYQKQWLKSQLDIRYMDGSLKNVADSFVNHLPFDQTTTSLQAEYYYTTRKIHLSLSIPILYRNIYYTNKNASDQISKVFVTPIISIKHLTAKEGAFTMSYGYTNRWGGIQDVFDGYLMQSYRNFNTNSGTLTQRKMHDVNLSYEKKNTLKAYFLNINASYTFNNANTILDNQYTTVIQRARTILFENITERAKVSAYISKYFFKLKIKFGARVTVQQDGANQLLNGTLLHYRNRLLSWESDMSIKFGSNMNLNYRSQFGYVVNTLTNAPGSQKNTRGVKSFNAKQQIGIAISVANNLMLTTDGEYYLSNAPGRITNRLLFVDAALVYKWNKLKTDIDFSLTNMGGADQYNVISATANNLIERSYQIRSRMALIKFLYRF